MKIKIAACVVCIGVMFAIGTATVIGVLNTKSTMTELNVSEKDTVFIVKSNNGKLAIFSEDGKLIKSTEFNVNSLPQKDIEILNEGLRVYGINGVRSAIEDYTS